MDQEVLEKVDAELVAEAITVLNEDPDEPRYSATEDTTSFDLSHEPSDAEVTVLLNVLRGIEPVTVVWNQEGNVANILVVDGENAVRYETSVEFGA